MWAEGPEFPFNLCDYHKGIKAMHSNICSSIYFHRVETEPSHLSAVAHAPMITAVFYASSFLDLCCNTGVTQPSHSFRVSCSVLAHSRSNVLAPWRGRNTVSRNIYQLRMYSSRYCRFLHELQHNRIPALHILRQRVVKRNKIGVNVGNS